MHRRTAVLVFALSTLSCRSQNKSEENTVTFQGMCDASGAIALSDRLVAVADDEENILHVYDVNKGGAPLHTYDLSPALGLFPRPSKNPWKPPKPPAELDIEAATRVGDTAFWITSHGLSSSGKLKGERFRFFATTIDRQKKTLSLYGAPYSGLIPALTRDARYAPFHLDRAVMIPPKMPGGLNIEGMTAGKNGGVWIGFRNPIPDGKALIFCLLNPKAVLTGARPKLSDPLLLDLKGRGVRALSHWRGDYLIMAGSYDGKGKSTLYALGETDMRLRRLLDFDSTDFNPEAFFTPESGDKMMIFSDDGTKIVDGRACKTLRDDRKKRFRGRLVSLSAVSEGARQP